jgi:uncharacterized RDD family membrane protein YckC
MNDRDLQQKRIVAAVIDIAIAVAISVAFWVVAAALGFAVQRAGSDTAVGGYVGRVLSFLGSLISVGYVLGRDTLAGSRSLGKSIQKLQVVTLDGGPITFMHSVRRNAIFAIGSGLGLLSSTLQLVPCLGDAVACLLVPLVVVGALVSLGAAIFELIKITQDPEGIRMGDQMAGTRVVR